MLACACGNRAAAAIKADSSGPAKAGMHRPARLSPDCGTEADRRCSVMAPGADPLQDSQSSMHRRQPMERILAEVLAFVAAEPRGSAGRRESGRATG